MPSTKRQEELITSLLAGNIFDWGAKEVAKMLEGQEFGFHAAKEKIPRNWFSYLHFSPSLSQPSKNWR